MKRLRRFRPGDIVLVRATGWRRQFCEFDHVAMLYWWSDDPATMGTWLTLESGFTGVRSWWPVGHWGKPYVVVRPRCGSDIAAKVVNEAMRWLGTPYGWFSLLKLIIARIRKALGIPIIVPLARHRPLSCGAFVALLYLQQGVNIAPGAADLESVSPDDVWNERQWTLVGEFDS